jgi:hypothetical protein
MVDPSPQPRSPLTEIIGKIGKFWAGLKIILFAVGIILPPSLASSRVGVYLGCIGGFGALIGWRWGAADILPHDASKRAAALLKLGLKFIGLYVVLELGLPFLGVWFPIIYELRVLFWGLVLIRGIAWAVGIGALVRLVVFLDRCARMRSLDEQ